MHSEWTPTNYDLAIADRLPVLEAFRYLANKKREHDDWQRARERNMRERAAWWYQVPRTKG